MLDALELSSFYEEPMGQVTRRQIMRRIRLAWPDLRGLRVLGYGFAPPYLKACLPEAERAQGRRVVDEAIGAGRVATPSNVFGFFAHAANLKLIDRSWWLEFWQAFLALEPLAIPLEFLPSPGHAPTDARLVSLHLRSTRELTAAIAATRMFISTDTGPMHLASTTAVPTVALFQASDPGLYGPLKPDDLAIDITGCTPREVAQRCQRIWAACASSTSVTARQQPIR